MRFQKVYLLKQFLTKQGASGVPKSWNFFLKRSYWKGRTKPRTPTKVLYQTVPDLQGDPDCAQPIIEQEPEGLVAGVTVTNLSKTYSNGKLALDDLSINFYENQITSFLGHNGAGVNIHFTWFSYTIHLMKLFIIHLRFRKRQPYPFWLDYFLQQVERQEFMALTFTRIWILFGTGQVYVRSTTPFLIDWMSKSTCR